MDLQEGQKERKRNRTWSQIRKESGVENLPLNVRSLFVRRYNSAIKKNDPTKAKNQAMSLVKTRFKKVRGKWVDRKNIK